MTKGLALITAAGYGRRYAKARGIEGGVCDKCFEKDEKGEYFISPTLGFLTSKQAGKLDFAILRRNEKLFERGNWYLREAIEFPQELIFYQQTKDRTHAAVLFLEYFQSPSGFLLGKRNPFREFIDNYDFVVVLPGDHNLGPGHLNLPELINQHLETESDLTAVYSRGWRQDTSKKDLVEVEKEQEGIHRIVSITRIPDPTRIEILTNQVKATSVGVWVFKTTPNLGSPKTRFLKVIPSLAIASLTLGAGKLLNMGFPAYAPPGVKAFAYYIENWQGGRDG